MAPYFPDEAIAILDASRGTFPLGARRYWRSRLLGAIRRHAEARAVMPDVIRATDKWQGRLLV
ncbi:hypothetical protein D3C87_1985210 [compost metagenome]